MRSLGKSRLHTLVSAVITQKNTCDTPFCPSKKFSLFSLLRMKLAFYTFSKLNSIESTAKHLRIVI